MKVLVLAPHADDETLGCGATIARHVDSGDQVLVAILTNASVGAPELFSVGDLAKVREEASSALTILGCEAPKFLEFPAPQLDQYPQYKLAQAIGEIVHEWQPNTLYLPFVGDLHVDHSAIARAGLVASRPHPGEPIKNVYAYETLSETEWGSIPDGGPFVPNHYVSVERQLERKLQALRCYASQLQDFPHSRSVRAVESLARYRGSSVGVPAAEAFMVVRQLAG